MPSANETTTCPDCSGESDGCEACAGTGELERCGDCGCYAGACDCATRFEHEADDEVAFCLSHRPEAA